MTNRKYPADYYLKKNFRDLAKARNLKMSPKILDIPL